MSEIIFKFQIALEQDYAIIPRGDLEGRKMGDHQWHHPSLPHGTMSWRSINPEYYWEFKEQKWGLQQGGVNFSPCPLKWLAPALVWNPFFTIWRQKRVEMLPIFEISFPPLSKFCLFPLVNKLFLVLNKSSDYRWGSLCSHFFFFVYKRLCLYSFTQKLDARGT